MILHCKAWSKTREQILPAIARLLAKGENVIWSGLDDGDKMQILMDITKTYQSLKINIKTTTEVEFHAIMQEDYSIESTLRYTEC
jgi:hypothetical protein